MLFITILFYSLNRIEIITKPTSTFYQIQFPPIFIISPKKKKKKLWRKKSQIPATSYVNGRVNTCWTHGNGFRPWWPPMWIVAIYHFSGRRSQFLATSDNISQSQPRWVTTHVSQPMQTGGHGRVLKRVTWSKYLFNWEHKGDRRPWGLDSHHGVGSPSRDDMPFIFFFFFTYYFGSFFIVT